MKCRQICKSGARCSKDAAIGGYCIPHFSIIHSMNHTRGISYLREPKNVDEDG